MNQSEQIVYIKNVAKKYAKSLQDADDIASISIEKAWKGELKNPEALKGWLYQIVKRSVYNFYRNTRPMVSIDDVPQGEYNLREFRMDFEKMTRRLKPRRKQCLQLYCMGYRWTDIAEELDISRQNARVSAMNGIETIKRWYGDSL